MTPTQSLKAGVGPVWSRPRGRAILRDVSRLRPISLPWLPCLITALALAGVACGDSPKADPADSGPSDQPPISQSEAGQSEPGQSELGLPDPNPAETTASPSVDPTTGPSGVPTMPVPALTGDAELITSGDEARRVVLRLSLPEGALYRVITIGMLYLPLIDKPTGFAREEEIALSNCEGEGGARSCLATHSYRNYDAEPPTGAGLKKEEHTVSGLTTAHRLDASGLRTTTTEVAGPAEFADAAPGRALAGLHRFNCIRLPSVPVGEGATWRDTCTMRQSGAVTTREVTWQLVGLDDSPEGLRAELKYAGTLVGEGPKATLREGQIQGVLYLWVDAGEPHLMRERLSFVLNAEKGLHTGTDLRFQFAKLAKDGETLMRTDGKPFDVPPTGLNDPRTSPNGDTRDAELPGQSSPAPN